jgi:glycine/D-amino acid oxidase-like deaminating enzyme
VRALICGAGIAGLTLARLLDAMGWQMDLVERAAGLRDEGYLIDFFGPGFVPTPAPSSRSAGHAPTGPGPPPELQLVAHAGGIP